MRLDPSDTNSSETTTDRLGRKPARRREQREMNPATRVSSPLTDDFEPSVDDSDSVGPRGLTGTQIQRLHQRLLEERAKAMRAIWVKRADMEDHRAKGQLDELEWDIRMAERQTEFIVLIEEALRRLRESPHDFDVSEVSGGPIPYERLVLVPWTRRLTQESNPFVRQMARARAPRTCERSEERS